MWFKILVLGSFLSVVLADLTNDTNANFLGYKKKYYSDLYKRVDSENASKRSEEYAGEALSEVYTECFAQISFSCLQKKVLSFINRMNRMEKFSLLGNYVSVVRTKDDYEPEQEFQARLNTAEKDSGLDDLMEMTIDRFFNNHIIRFKVPNSFAVLKNSEARNFQEDSTALDFRFPYSNEVEARKKNGGGGKMGKKMMMMMMMAMKAKMMMMGPIMMGMAGMMAMKALIAGVISLTISKIMLIKKLMKQKNMGGGGGGWESSGGGGGGGGGWSSGGGGGGGWDRRSTQDQWDASNLAYRAYSTVENLF